MSSPPRSHEGDGRRLVEHGQGGRLGDQDDQEDGGLLAGQQLVVAKGPEGRQIKEDHSTGRGHLTEQPPATPVVDQAPQVQADPCQDTDGHPAQLADPFVFESVLQEKGGGKEQKDHRRPAQAARCRSTLQGRSRLSGAGQGERSDGKRGRWASALVVSAAIASPIGSAASAASAETASISPTVRA